MNCSDMVQKFFKLSDNDDENEEINLGSTEVKKSVEECKI